MSCDCEAGLRTRSITGPMSRRRKASSSPTPAIRSTDNSTCHQYGATYRSKRVNCRIAYPDVRRRGGVAAGSKCSEVSARLHFTGTLDAQEIEWLGYSASVLAPTTHFGMSRCITLIRYP